MGNFQDIDGIELNELYKWKIAFLYSSEQLLPIYKYETIKSIADAQGVPFNNRPNRSKALIGILQNKPSSYSIYEYADELYRKYGEVANRESERVEGTRRKKNRKPSETLNNNSGSRKGSLPGKRVDLHTPLQKRLRSALMLEHPNAEILFEHNYVDVKALLPDRILFFEVKTRGDVSQHIKDGLGQLLAYVNDDNDPREKEIFIAGGLKPSKIDIEFIEFLKLTLNLKFEYRFIDL